MVGTVDRDLVAVVASAAAGDEIAFERIVAGYHEQMYCICVALCRDRSLAEEAVQSAWSKVWRELRSLREPAKLRPWLASIAVNEARQLLRQRRWRWGQTAIVDASQQPGGLDPATGVDGMDLRAAMRRLDPDDRALLAMRYVLGFDATELATAVGLSPSGVRTRLERLLARLRRELR